MKGDAKMIAGLDLWRTIIPVWSRRNFFKTMKFDRISDASNHSERRFKQITEYGLNS